MNTYNILGVIGFALFSALLTCLGMAVDRLGKHINDKWGDTPRA